jgi:hypothetical protein
MTDPLLIDPQKSALQVVDYQIDVLRFMASAETVSEAYKLI